MNSRFPDVVPGAGGLEEERRRERDAERERTERFGERFPALDRLPVARLAFRAAYTHGIAQLLALAAVIAVFTAIKAPYIGAPFTGEHSMKYNTYVEPAVYMAQKGTMLWNQKKYVADPVHNPEGIFERFDHLPLMEWSLFLAQKVFPDSGMERRTRIVTHAVGVAILLAAYRFFCGYYPKSFSILFTGLLSINPVFSFSTYVTVLDSIVILFMFLSLIQLHAYSGRKRAGSLIQAALWFGLGNAVKYPLFLWLAPIAVLLIFAVNEEGASSLETSAIYLSISLLVTFAMVYVTRTLISSPVSAAAAAGGLGALLLLLWYLLDRGIGSVHGLFATVWEKKTLLVVLCGAAVGAGLVLARFLRLTDYAGEFLTEPGLVGNPRLYKYMLFTQFKNYMTRNLFWIGLFGFPLALMTGDRVMRRVGLPFLAGSLLYWVAASKSMFFHIYYSLIVMIALTIGAAYFLHFVTRTVQAPRQRTIVLLCFLALVFPPALDATTGRMKNHVSVEKAVGFIKENTAPDEFILFEGFLTPISIYAGRGFVMPAVLADNTFRADVRALGFADAMRKYRIKYLFTPNERPFYADYAPIFEPTSILEPSGQNYNRIIKIHETIGTRDPGIAEELRHIEEITARHRIEEKFVLAEQIGRFKFYTFRN